MPGPPPKPTRLKLVKGTLENTRANPREPKAEPGRPEAPSHLQPRAREAWDYVVPLLDRMGILTEADGMGLERLCELYADILEARASLNREVHVLTPDAGATVLVAAAGEITYVTYGKGGPMLRSRPELTLIADADRRFRGYLQDFGLTPSARSRVSTLGQDAEPDSAEKYFGT